MMMGHLLTPWKPCEQGGLRQAQDEFGVKKDRISRTLRGKHLKKYSGQTILTAEEETILVDRLALLAEWGQPLSLFDVRMFVKSYLDHKGRKVAKFANNCPGKDWADGFMTRHKAVLSVRFAQNIKKARAQVGPDVVNRGSATGGGDGGDASPPFLRVRGIIPPIFRKIVGQIR